MAEPVDPTVRVYQCRVWLRDISPLIWRRLLIRGDTTLATLHTILQAAFAWEHEHLYAFRIYGQEYGTGANAASSRTRHLSDFHLRRNERVQYTYNFFANWVHEIRIEAIQPVDPRKAYPWCAGGARAAPAEDCRDAWAFMALRQHYHLLQIQVIVTQDDGPELPPIEVVTLERTEFTPETVGLTLADGKRILNGIQTTMAQAQVATYTDRQQACPVCHQPRARKGMHHLVYRTAFGRLSLPSPRFYSCPCTPQAARSTSPLATLLAERTAPELCYLGTKWASLVSYGVTVDLLAEVLPMQTHPTTIQRQVHHVAERLEQAIAAAGPVYIEGCPAQWSQLPQPDEPLAVSLDGGYVHARTASQRKAGCFEIIVAKSIPTAGPSRCMGFVQGYDQHPKRRLFELLTEQGLQMNQAITFLSDGGDTVRDLPLYLSPEADHLLDWFHVVRQEVAYVIVRQGHQP